ncbi:MAG: epimerase, partial [Terracidiphilus sp.]
MIMTGTLDPHPFRPLRILLPGGSGLIGHLLARRFLERGHQVTVLTRAPYTAPWLTVRWDGEHPGPWIDHLEGSDVCINLTGRSINCRHNTGNRRSIYESRIGSTRLLGQAIAALNQPPRLWMNASAATIYPRLSDENGVDLPLDETTPAMDGRLSSEQAGPDTASRSTSPRWTERRDFSRRVVRDWEAEFFAAETPRTRKIALRTAVVLSPVPSSAFAVLSRLVRAGLGGTQGNGRQFVPWIHAADYASAVEFLMAREDLDGPFNLAAPNPLPNRQFMAALREAWEMPNGLPAPRLAIEIGAFFLRTAPELVLGSCRAVPGRLVEAGFAFAFPFWPDAAQDLVQQWRHRND